MHVPTTDQSEGAVPLAQVLDAIPAIVWLVDAVGNVVYANAAWCEYSGRDSDSTLNKPLESLLEPHPATPDISGLRSRQGDVRWFRITRSKMPDSSLEFVTATEAHDDVALEREMDRLDLRLSTALRDSLVTMYAQDACLRYTWLCPITEHYEQHSKGRTDEELLPPEEAAELMAVKQQVLESGEPARVTIPATVRGVTHYYQLLVNPILEEEKVVGVAGVAIDVTSQQLAEHALRESESRFRRAIETSPLPKIIHAEDGEILYASKAWTEATGYSVEDAGTVQEWISKVAVRSPELNDAFAAAFQEDSHREDSAEQVICTRDGRELIWIITSAPMGLSPDGRRLAITAGIDVTARKRTEEGHRFLTQAGSALAESLDFEKTLETIARLAVPVMADWCSIDLYDAQSGIKRGPVAHIDPEKVRWARGVQSKYPVDLEAPSGLANVLRTGRSELISVVTQEMIDAANLEEDVLEVVYNAEIASMLIVPILARGITLGAITFVSSVPGRYTESDVTIFEELSRMAGLAIENARLYSSIQSDLEDRRRAEEEIRTLNASLNERVRERTAELEAANREMEGFTYSVSHDLRAPLRAIMSTSMILLEEAGHSLGPDERLLLQRQAAAAKKMGILIDELLKLSRLSRQELVKEPVSLSLLAQDIAEELRAEGRADHIIFAIEDDLEAVGDARLLRFVLLNLMENACKFSPRGGTVTVGQEGPLYFVRDQGIGFDMAYHHKLFMAFERLVNESEYPGTGIGLANVQRIVQRHGGEVWARSKPGHGSTFYFTLEPGVAVPDSQGNEHA